MSRNRIARLNWFIALTLAVALVLPTGRAQATPPISGLTLEFGNGFDVAASGDTVEAVKAGDLDGDGDLDLVSGSNNSGEDFELIVWQNDGTPFAGGAWAQTDAGASAGPVKSVALGDLDRDGDLDIVSGSGSAEDFELIAWQNDGTPFTGTWAATDVGASADGVNAVALGDLDSDGDLDLVSASREIEDFELIAWQNDGTPFTGAWAQTDLGASADDVTSIAIGDLDRDGDPDVVSASDVNEDFELIAWQNDHTPFSGGVWAANDISAAASGVFAVALADLDRDGDPDVVSGQGSGTEMIVYQNNGTPFTGTWGATTVGSTDAAVFAVDAGDLDGDGDVDIVSGSGSAEDFEVIAWQSAGTPFTGGTWTQSDLGASLAVVRAVTLADLDRDGDLDLVSSSDSGEDFEIIGWQNTHVHRNAPFNLVASGAGANDGVFAIASGDLDRDGDVDMVTGGTGSEDFEVFAWQNDGTPFTGGIWAQTGVGATTTGIISLALGDLDGDGDLDIVSSSVVDAGGSELVGWQNDGTPFTGGAWTSQALGDLPDSVGALALGDLDRDGDLDVVSGSGALASFELVTWQNDGTPFNDIWTGLNAGSTTAGITDLALADFDEDGFLDIVTGIGAGALFEVVVWRKNTPFTPGLWASTNVGASADSVLAVAVGDLDRDGDPDIVTGSNPNEDFEVIAWQNDATPFSGSWAQTDVGASPNGVFDVQVGDLDADGYLDIVIGRSSLADFEVVTWANDETPFGGGWAQTNVGATLSDVIAVTLGDLDRDGDLDLVSGGTFSNDFEMAAWQNIGGVARLAATPAAAGAIANSAEGSVFKLAFNHNGQTGDQLIEMATLNLFLARLDCVTPLSTVEANALIDVVRMRIDDGDGVFEPGEDFGVFDLSTLSLTSGVQSMTLTDSEATLQASPGFGNTYWINFLTTAGASSQVPYGLCVKFDPDANMVVEGVSTPDYSVSIQDTAPAGAGTLVLARLSYMPLVLSPGEP